MAFFRFFIAAWFEDDWLAVWKLRTLAGMFPKYSLPKQLQVYLPGMWSQKVILGLLSLIVLTACTSSSLTTAQQPVTAPASRSIENKGSDTMVNLALAWAEEYQNLHQDVRISVTGGGTGTGIASLLNRTVDIANASRKIKPEEIESARANGINPQEYVVARDAIAVIVHPDNPIRKLTLQQISDIYSGRIQNWAELGGENRPIVRLSRETNSGTHVYFLESVIRMGSKEDKTIFSADTLLLPSSEGIIAEVSDNPNAIGYDGLGYITSTVKMLAIAPNDEAPYELPSIETVNAKTYPISRELFMYTSDVPSGELKAYLDWIFSPEGQKVVERLGFVPVQAQTSEGK